jgi:hypothetical protein
MIRKLLLASALAGLLGAPVAQAQDGAVFRPTGGWTADYGTDYCRLIRNFSDGNNQVSLALERTQPGANLRLILVGGGLRPFRGADEIGFNLLPDTAERKSRYIRADVDGGQLIGFDAFALKPAAFTPGAPPAPYNRGAEQEAARAITGIALGSGMTDAVRFETGSLRAPVAALQTCADDLLKVWGLDADKHATLTAPPMLVPNPTGVLPQGTIPFGEFDKLLGAANQVRLLVGADGKPTACTIYQPTLGETLNSRICTLAMANAAFTPAKDAAGAPMASFWMGSPMFLGPPLRGRGPGGR